MNDLREFAYLLGLFSILGFAGRRVYAGYKAGQQSANKAEDANPNSIGFRRKQIALRVSWLIKDLLITSLLFAVWMGLTCALANDRGGQVSISYSLCGADEFCARRAVQDMSEQLLGYASIDRLVVCALLVFAAVRWFRLVSLAGQVRLGKTSLPATFKSRLKISSKLVFLLVALMQTVAFVTSVRANRSPQAVPTQTSTPAGSLPSPRREPPVTATPAARAVGSQSFAIYSQKEGRLPRYLVVYLGNDGRTYYQSSGAGLQLLDAQRFAADLPGSALLLEGITTEELQNSPHTTAYKTVLALCIQKIAVVTLEPMLAERAPDQKAIAANVCQLFAGTDAAQPVGNDGDATEEGTHLLP